MGKRRIVLVGGGGHCRSVLDCLLETALYDEIGIVTRDPQDGPGPMGVPIVGSDRDLPALLAGGWSDAAVALGSVGHPERRESIFRGLKKMGFSLPVIRAPSAVIGREVSLGEGTFVGKRTVINCGAKIGVCAIINTAAVVEHDCHVEDFAHAGPGSALCGLVHVGKRTHIGAGAVVRQQIRIGRDCVIGAGSVVVRDIPDGIEAYGNPCRAVNGQ